jgi:hypothetical protein
MSKLPSRKADQTTITLPCPSAATAVPAVSSPLGETGCARDQPGPSTYCMAKT